MKTSKIALFLLIFSFNNLFSLESDSKLNSETPILTADQISQQLNAYEFLLPELNMVIADYAETYFENEYKRLRKELDNVTTRDAEKIDFLLNLFSYGSTSSPRAGKNSNQPLILNLSKDWSGFVRSLIINIHEQAKILKESLLRINNGRHTCLIENFINIEADTFIIGDMGIQNDAVTKASKSWGDAKYSSEPNSEFPIEILIKELHDWIETNKSDYEKLDDKLFIARYRRLIFYLIIKNEKIDLVKKAIEIAAKFVTVNQYYLKDQNKSLDDYVNEQMEIRNLSFMDMANRYKQLYEKKGIRNILTSSPVINDGDSYEQNS